MRCVCFINFSSTKIYIPCDQSDKQLLIVIVYCSPGAVHITSSNKGLWGQASRSSSWFKSVATVQQSENNLGYLKSHELSHMCVVPSIFFYCSDSILILLLILIAPSFFSSRLKKSLLTGDWKEWKKLQELPLIRQKHISRVSYRVLSHLLWQHKDSRFQ